MPSARGKRTGMGELCNDLLESPYIGKFANDDNRELLSQSQTEDSQSELESSRTYTTESRREESTLQTNPNLLSNGMLSNQALSSKGNQPGHVYSVDNSSSMVMYNGTIRTKTPNEMTEITTGQKNAVSD